MNLSHVEKEHMNLVGTSFRTFMSEVCTAVNLSFWFINLYWIQFFARIVPPTVAKPE